MTDFNGKVAAITGAGSGIGRALALELARRQCALALSDINDQALAETVEMARAYGVRITNAHLDVADRAAVEAWAEQVVAEHGKVNLIFNNAGVALTGTVEETSYEDFEWLININFWGVVYGTRAFLPHLRASGDGHVVNIASVFGLLSVPTQSAYNAAKFAVRGFTDALAHELELSQAPVKVTCVLPGGIKTNIARDGRIVGDPGALAGRSGGDMRAQSEKVLVTSPRKAAAVILAGVERNRRRVLIGRDAKFLDTVVRLMPSLGPRLLLRGMRRAFQSRAADGNVKT